MISFTLLALAFIILSRTYTERGYMYYRCLDGSIKVIYETEEHRKIYGE